MKIPDLSPALECPLCMGLLNEPIDLSDCKNCVCAECMCEWLQQSQFLACPCCFFDHLQSYDSIGPAPEIVLSILADQKVVCGRCNKTGRVRHVDAHVESQCMSFFTTSNSPAIDDILSQSRDLPLTDIKQKLQSSLVCRSMSTSPILQVKTGGQVSQFFQHTHI